MSTHNPNKNMTVIKSKHHIIVSRQMELVFLHLVTLKDLQK